MTTSLEDKIDALQHDYYTGGGCNGEAAELHVAFAETSLTKKWSLGAVSLITGSLAYVDIKQAHDFASYPITFKPFQSLSDVASRNDNTTLSFIINNAINEQKPTQDVTRLDWKLQNGQFVPELPEQPEAVVLDMAKLNTSVQSRIDGMANPIEGYALGSATAICLTIAAASVFGAVKTRRAISKLYDKYHPAENQPAPQV